MTKPNTQMEGWEREDEVNTDRTSARLRHWGAHVHLSMGVLKNEGMHNK